MFASGQSTSPESHQKSRREYSSSIILMIAGTESIAPSSESAEAAILR